MNDGKGDSGGRRNAKKNGVDKKKRKEK